MTFLRVQLFLFLVSSETFEEATRMSFFPSSMPTTLIQSEVLVLRRHSIDRPANTSIRSSFPVTQRRTYQDRV
jgi:hypothetical protein